MNIWPVCISGRVSATAFAATVLVSGFFAGSTLAQSDPAEVEIIDPLDGLCAKIGRPLSATEVAKFAGHIVRGVSTEYQEVISDFTDGRARSVRYLADGKRTAQFVYAEGRKICLTAPDRDKITCGVPLVCSSSEADYVMVDLNDDPFVRIDRPAKPDPNAPLPPVDHDWVTYAGGTTRLSIEDEPIGRQGATGAKNIKNQDQCRVGRGHPALDRAYAYFWTGSGCNAQFASNNGTVTYLSDVGEIGTIKLGKGTGIETINGQLRWSFSDKPFQVAVKCFNQGDTAIPKSAREVAHIEVDIVIPSAVETGDPFVYSKLVDEVREDIERICGRGMIAKETEIRFRRGSNELSVDLKLVWNGTRANPESNTAPALQRVSRRNNNAKPNAITRFARFIRQSVDAQKTFAILAALREASELPNIADGMRESDVQTLVAMTKGISTRMPWAMRNPNYANDEFRLSWTIMSRDPVPGFFRTRRQHPGWVAIERAVPASPKPQVQLSLTCIVPVRDARNLANKKWVSVDATMVSFDRDSMVMRCKAQ
jgi:hypothetical protein